MKNKQEQTFMERLQTIYLGFVPFFLFPLLLNLHRNFLIAIYRANLKPPEKKITLVHGFGYLEVENFNVNPHTTTLSFCLL